MTTQYYNFEELGIDPLVDILALWNMRLTNMKASSIPIEKRKKIIIETIRKMIRTKPDHLKFVSIAAYFKPKEKKEKDIDINLLKYNIGDEVLYNDSKYRTKWVLAKVVKFNTKSLTIQLDTYRTIEDLKAMQDQTFGTDRLLWNYDFTGRKVVILDTKNIYSKEDCISRDRKYILKHFEEGSYEIDWGY